MAFDFGFEKMIKAFTGEKTIKSEATIKDGKFSKDVVPSFLEGSEISTKKISEAAKSACDFFGLPEIPVKEGPGIAVRPGNPMTFKDDIFYYNKAELKKAGLTNPVDIAKAYTHECGHRISQRFYMGKNSWANELCADFFVGARNEMLGIKNGNFEKFLGKQRASITHPGGKMRMQAMDYGRKCVAEMKAKGIKPTWENLMEKFKETNAEKVSYANYISSRAKTGIPRPQDRLKGLGSKETKLDFSEGLLGLSSSHHINQADIYKNRHKHNVEVIGKAIKSGDYKRANEAAYWAKVNKKHELEEINAAQRAIKKGK